MAHCTFADIQRNCNICLLPALVFEFYCVKATLLFSVRYSSFAFEHAVVLAYPKSLANYERLSRKKGSGDQEKRGIILPVGDAAVRGLLILDGLYYIVLTT
jgi:hypothetical protein